MSRPGSPLASEQQTKLLSAVDQFIEAIDFLHAEAHRQYQECSCFWSGKRQSKYPIGSKFFINMGNMLDRLVQRTEAWSRIGENDAWKKR